MLKQRISRAPLRSYVKSVNYAYDWKDGKNTVTKCFPGKWQRKREALVMSFVFLFVVTLLIELGFLIRPKDLSLSAIVPPPDLIVRAEKRSHYQPVPKNYKYTFFVSSNGEFRLPVTRALRSLGFKMTKDVRTAHIIWDKWVQTKRYTTLHAWQRYNHIPGFQIWDNKDTFAQGFEAYQKRNPEKKLYFLPETFYLGNEKGLVAFEKRLENGGIHQPWVLKVPNVNNGRGIEMLGGNSQKLQNVVERVRLELHHLAKNATFHNNISSTDSRDEDDTNDSKWKRKMHDNYVIQAFICNELTWHGGKKFDLRMHWMIPSIDPLIVLFSDGFVRVGSSTYDEVDFSDTTRHLTTMTHLDGEAKGTMDEFKQLIHEHFYRNYRNLSKRFKGDPYQHVRKQMMEVIAETIAAFREVTFGNANVTLRPENAFSLYGADFVLDNNLDIWFLEPQGGPGFIEDYDFKVALHRDMLRSTFSMMIEIQEKLEKDPLANVLPLGMKYGEWDIVYAGNWLYQYKEYNRPPPSQACNTSPMRLPIHLNKSSQLRGLNAWRTRQRSSRPAYVD